MHEAEEYTLSVRKERIEDEIMYVARVEELPDVEEYADTYEFARELALDTIRTTQKVFSKQGLEFPSPKQFTANSASGRVTLRLKKSTHAQAIVMAEKEGVSLNTYIASCVERNHSFSEICNIKTQVEQLAHYVRGMNAEQAVNFTIISKLVSNHAHTIHSKIRFDEEDRDFDPKSSVHRFLLRQDVNYAYD